MTDMIDDLFYGNLDPALLEIKRGSDYNKKRTAILTILETLEEAGYEQESSKLGDLLSEVDFIISKAYFSVGFRWGARMVLSIIDDSNDVFEMPK